MSPSFSRLDLTCFEEHGPFSDHRAEKPRTICGEAIETRRVQLLNGRGLAALPTPSLAYTQTPSLFPSPSRTCRAPDSSLPHTLARLLSASLARAPS
eukprot:5151198-Pleurochrysis_carterae.AAC.1